MASQLDPYGLETWAVILIGVGGATLVTIFLATISTIARRRILKAHTPVLFTIFPVDSESTVAPKRWFMRPQTLRPIGENVEERSDGSPLPGNDVDDEATTKRSYVTPMKSFTTPEEVHLSSFTTIVSADVAPPNDHPNDQGGMEKDGPLMMSLNDESQASFFVPEASEELLSPQSPDVKPAKSERKRSRAPRKPDDSLAIASHSSYSEIEPTSAEKQIDAEFKNLPSAKVDGHSLPADSYVKNRYSSILPSPHALVPLKDDGYINANFVNGFDGKPKSYIATQAPMENTVNDFWQMAFDQNVSVIVMVTYLYEYGVEKCIQYWPDDGAMRYGDIKVVCLEELHQMDYIRTTLHLKNIKSDTSKVLWHFAFTGWPEHGMPKSTAGMRKFIEDFNKEKGDGVVLIHCSGGVGRTGMIIAIDIGIKKLQNSQSIDIAEIITNIRTNRPGAVQTRSQYRFVYKALRNYVEEESSPAV